MIAIASVNGQLYKFNSKKDLNNIKTWKEVNLIELELNSKEYTVFIQKEEDYNNLVKLIENEIKTI